MVTTTAPKSTGLKYTYRDGEGYREWYKANMGADWDGNYLSAKPEGMSDVDWMQGTMIQRTEAEKAAAAEQKAQTGQQLTDIYNQQTSAAQNSYNAMASQYTQQMKNDLEYAGVLHEIMKKYVPQQMAAQGMGGMGITQTAGANAVAKHMSNRSAIIGQHQASMNELNRTHGERQAALDAGHKQDMMALDQKYNDRMTQLNDQYFNDEMALFGQTVKEKAAEQESYFMSGLDYIKQADGLSLALAMAEQLKPYVSQEQYDRLVIAANIRGNELKGIADVDRETGYDETEVRILDLIEGAMTREEAQAWVDEAIADGSLPEDRRTYLEGKIANKFGAEDKEEREAAFDKTVASMNDLIARGTTASKLEADLQSYIDSGSIRPEDAEHFKKVIASIKEAETKVAGDAKAEVAKSLILAETTAEGRKTTLEKYKGQISEEAYTSLSNLIDTLDRNDAASDKTAASDKAAGQLRDLFSAGTDSAKLKETLESMIEAGTIPKSDRTYWEGLISAVETVEQEAAGDKKAAEQLQEMTYAQDLILKAVDAAERAEQLAACKGKVSDAQYSYLERLVSVLDGNQQKEDTQAGYDQADTDLRTLYQAGASSADLQSTYDALAAAGKIEPGREQFWKSMISLRQNEEKEIEQGKINTDQAENANFALMILGDAMDPESRAQILEGCATWLEQGKITQTQYDMIVQYAGVLDGNAEYLNQQEKDAEAKEDHEVRYENTLTYIAFAAVDYDDAVRYAEEHREEFSDTEWESIQVQLAARKKADDDANLAEQDTAQAEAEERFLDQMSLYASSPNATEKIRELLESFKDKLHPDVYGAWKMYVDDLAKSPLQQYNESLAAKDEDMAQKELDAQAKGYESWADYDSAVLMGREPVYDDFYIKGTPIADADIPELVTKKIKHDGFSGPYDPNHTTTWVEVGANKYVVWYEGEWYWATGPNSTPKADTMVGTIQDQYGIR